MRVAVKVSHGSNLILMVSTRGGTPLVSAEKSSMGLDANVAGLLLCLPGIITGTLFLVLEKAKLAIPGQGTASFSLLDRAA